MATHDQAYKLRDLARYVSRMDAATKGAVPRMIVTMGGKSDVGTTTLTVNLAVALAQQGRRAVLVDVNLDRPRVAVLCGVGQSLGVVDVLSAQRDIHEVLQPGPAGLQIIAGSPNPRRDKHRSQVAHQRLIDQLKSLGRHADFVVLDLGTGARDVASRYWSAADQLLMVTTTDSECVMDTYATIKTLRDGNANRPRIYSVVNRAIDDAVAIDVHRRIDRSCRRFLSLAVAAAGHVPLDDNLARAADHAVPASMQSPTCPAVRADDRMAAMLVASATVLARQSAGRSAA